MSCFCCSIRPEKPLPFEQKMLLCAPANQIEEAYKDLPGLSGCVSCLLLFQSETRDGSEVAVEIVRMAQFYDRIDPENFTSIQRFPFRLESPV